MDEENRMYERLVALLLDEFEADLLGALVTGSRVHGTPGPTSDLDAHVIIAAPRRQRRNFMLEGIEIELFINPPFQVRRYFADGRGHDPHMFVFGRAVYDPHGVVARLRGEARAIWEAGPPPIQEHLVWMERYFPADLLRDLDDLGDDDEATAVLLLAALAERLIAAHYRLNGRWAVKAKGRFTDLATWDGEAARLVRTALSSQPIAARRAAIAQLAERVVLPLGGLMPLEWATDWEDVQR
jgi:predicted nucleotidyltransferase